MEIHIKLAEVQLGPFSREQVREYMADGLLSSRDLARLDGSDVWEPVGELLAKMPPRPPLPPPVVEATETEEQASFLTPEEPAPASQPEEKAKEVVPLPIEAPSLPAPAAPEPSSEPVRSTSEIPAESSPTASSEPSPASPEQTPTLPEATLSQALPIRVKTSSKKPITLGRSDLSPSQALPFPVSSTKKPGPLKNRILPRISLPEETARPSSVVSTNLTREPVRAIPKPPSETKPSATGPISAEALPVHDLPDRPAAKKSLSDSQSVSSRASSVTPVPKMVAPAPMPIKVLTRKPAAKLPVSTTIQLAPLHIPKSPESPAQIPPTVPTPPPEPVLLPEPSPTPIPKPAAPTEAPNQKSDHRLIYLGIGIFIFVIFVLAYLALPYSSAKVFWKALDTGDKSQLENVIDFPAVRQSLKTQLAAHPSQSPAVQAMMERSIDLYLTPDGLSKLINKSEDFPKVEGQPSITSRAAREMLLTLDSHSIRNQHLDSFSEYVIDLDAMRLHLGRYGTGWKLNQVEVEKQVPLPSPSNNTTNSVETEAALATPVVETFINSGKAKFQQGDWDGAIADFNQVLNLDPRMAAAYNNRAFAKQSKGDLTGAISDFTQAVTIDPQLSEVFFARGNAKATKGDLDGAMADYNQAINIDPKLEGAYYNRGNGRTARGDFDGAIADYTVVVTLNPNQANAYGNRGFAHRAKNDLDAAIADYTQALAIDPKISAAYYNRGLARQAQGNSDGAILDFNQALDIDPKMVGAYFNRGNAKNTKHDLEGAIADYNQALSIDPKIALAYCNRGLAKQGKSDFDGAVADYSQALDLDPKIAVAYYNRGLIKEQKDDLDGAIDDSSKALELDPTEAQAFYNRGFAKLTKGNLEGAKADLRQFCQMVPRDHYSDHARLYLWLIAKAQKNSPDANQNLSDSLLNDWNSTQEDLVTKIADFLLDRMSENELLSSASSANAKKDQGQHCEVWYFAGMKRLLMGDRTTAIDYFKKCLATEKTEFCEYILAKAELKSLDPSAANKKP